MDNTKIKNCPCITKWKKLCRLHALSSKIRCDCVEYVLYLILRNLSHELLSCRVPELSMMSRVAFQHPDLRMMSVSSSAKNFPNVYNTVQTKEQAYRLIQLEISPSWPKHSSCNHISLFVPAFSHQEWLRLHIKILLTMPWVVEIGMSMHNPKLPNFILILHWNQKKLPPRL